VFVLVLQVSVCFNHVPCFLYLLVYLFSWFTYLVICFCLIICLLD
jgi:hypothetical protein